MYIIMFAFLSCIIKDLTVNLVTVVMQTNKFE